MFDFFEDVYLELKGDDSTAVEREEKAEREKKREEKFIFSRNAKIIIFILGILYLIMAGFNVTTLKETGGLNIFKILRFILLILLDVCGLVCLIIKDKRAEISALIFIIIFVLTQYFTTMMM